MLKNKLMLAMPAVASVASFAAGEGSGSTGLGQATVNSATEQLVTFGGYVITGIAGVIAVSAGLRLLVKGINRAVGK